MTSVLEAIVGEGGDVAVFPIREFWLDIGQHEDYASADGHYDRLFK
jgi:NDP-sugar pyrophosphorylase family protein